jgi:hypothetical protein
MRIGCPLLFPNNLTRVFIVAHGDEFDVADMVRICPFKEVESGNKFRPYPNAIADPPRLRFAIDCNGHR